MTTMNDNNGINWAQGPTRESNGRNPTSATAGSGNKKTSCLQAVFKLRPTHLALGLVILLAILLFLTCWYTVRLRHEMESTCTSRECIYIASQILEHIDPSIDPCDDFYKFSCNNFVRTSYVPDDYSAKNLLQSMQEAMFVELRYILEEKIDKDEEFEVKQIKRLYRSCLNETTLDGLGVGGNELGGSPSVDALYELIINLTGHQWPIMTSVNETITEHESLAVEERLARMYLHQVQPFFQVIVNLNRSSSAYALHVFPGSPVMEQLHLGNVPSLDVENHTMGESSLPPASSMSHLFSGSGNETLAHYRKFVIDMIEAFVLVIHNRAVSGDTSWPGHSRKRLEKDVDAMLAFELKLVNLTRDQMEVTNCTQEPSVEELEECFNQMSYLNISLGHLAREMPEMKLHVFFQTVFTELGMLDKSQSMLFHSREFYQNLAELLASTEERVILNYLGWSIMAKYVPYLGQPFRSLSMDYQQKAIIIDLEQPDTPAVNLKFYNAQWKQCVFVSCDSLKVAGISAYLQKKRPLFERRRARIHKLIEMVKTMFLKIIDRQRWIRSKRLREIFKRRVKTITSNVGVPEFMFNRSHIESMYAHLHIDENEELVKNIASVMRHETRLEMRKINTQTRKNSDWLFQPLDANAFYDFTSNDMIIPVGIMHNPLVTLEVPTYLDLSFLGIVIGHEIAHSVDMNSRKQFSEKGQLFGDLAFSAAYRQMAQCFIDVYSKYLVDEVKSFVNGNHTLEENICDYASFQTAYAIFETLPAREKLSLPGLANYSVEQIFFLRYGQLWCEVTNQDGHIKSLLDNHSPGRFRTNGVLMNTRQFAEAFKCPRDSRMNPAKKCDLWTMS